MRDFTEALRFFLDGAPRLQGRMYHFPERLGEHTVYGLHDLELGIFIECKEVPSFQESFTKITMKSEDYVIKDENKHGLLISADVKGFSASTFMGVCREFYDPTDGDLDYNLKNPEEWVANWKKMVGNKLSNRPTYQILGELLGLEEVVSKHYRDVSWDGVRGGINDISALGDGPLYVEVKSTIQRTSTEVMMPEEYEIQKAHYLSFYRFEEDSSGGLSLRSQILRLHELGFDCPEFDNLRSLDTSILNKKYHLVEQKTYGIDENFPDIRKGFIDGKKPRGIGRIQYGIILGGLETTEIPDCPPRVNYTTND